MNNENQNTEYKRLWKDEYLKWVCGYAKNMIAFDKANLSSPEFMVEQGGITAIIPREIFMAIRDGRTSNEAESKPNQSRTEKSDTRTDKVECSNYKGRISCSFRDS